MIVIVKKNGHVIIDIHTSSLSLQYCSNFCVTMEDSYFLGQTVKVKHKLIGVINKLLLKMTKQPKSPKLFNPFQLYKSYKINTKSIQCVQA